MADQLQDWMQPHEKASGIKKCRETNSFTKSPPYSTPLLNLNIQWIATDLLLQRNADTWHLFSLSDTAIRSLPLKLVFKTYLFRPV